jgi:predicted nucleic acid-binding protein
MTVQDRGVVHRDAILIDTSAVFAILDTESPHHAVAKSFFASQVGVQWCAVDVTAHEAFTRVRQESDVRTGKSAFEILRKTPVRKLQFQEADEQRAWRMLDDYDDQDLSYHDVLCAALMLRVGLFRVFAFDHDFLLFGFQLEPGVFGPRRKFREH